MKSNDTNSLVETYEESRNNILILLSNCLQIESRPVGVLDMNQKARTFIKLCVEFMALLLEPKGQLWPPLCFSNAPQNNASAELLKDPDFEVNIASAGNELGCCENRMAVLQDEMPMLTPVVVVARC